MRLPFGYELSLFRKEATISLETLMQRLDTAYATTSGIAVTPENCEQAPTVKAIVTAVSRRISTLPVHVFLKSVKKGRATKEPQPNHPVERLLSRPNDYQTSTSFWLDSASALVRYANNYAFKARGMTGPIRRLEWLDPGAVEVEQDDERRLVYHVAQKSGRVTYAASEMHHARGPARNGYKGDSPVMDVRETIALEIAAERMGSAVFGNDARPGLIFEYLEASQGHKTAEERNQFVEDFQNSYSGKRRWRAMLMPKGIKFGQQLTVENEKAQFLQTRQHQRSVIAGAFGVPPHMVGDLSKGTFNNVEQQSLEFVQTVVLPYCRIFEAAMERDLLTDEDRRAGIIIRFNLDGALRGSFLDRQQGLSIQRTSGVISANEWREREGMNPREDEGGDDYYETGPSGQTPAGKPGDEPEPDDEEDDDETAS